jgi:hypothetical protein
VGALATRETSRKELEALAEKGLLWAVADGCDEPRVPSRAAELGLSRAVCLWDASSREEELAVAPYLLHLDGAGLEWLLEELAAGPWGILAVSKADLATLRRHFKELLTVDDPDGTPLFFRYFDPRVLPPFLTACTRGEIQQLLGPCQALGVTGAEPGSATFFLG